MEHARELVSGLEDGVDAASDSALVIVIEPEDFREAGHVLGEEEAGHFGRTGLDGGCESLSAPYGCYGGVACKELLVPVDDF